MDWEALATELRDIAKAVWPDTATTARGTYDLAYVVTKPNAEIRLPFAVVDQAEARKAQVAPARAAAYEFDVQINYARHYQGPTDLAAIAAKVEEMRAHLETKLRERTLENGQIIAVASFGWGYDVPLNQILAMKKLSAWSGRVVIRIKKGEVL